MSARNDDDDNAKIKQIVEMLKFVLTVEDEEIMKSSIESVIEMLEEINQ